MPEVNLHRPPYLQKNMPVAAIPNYKKVGIKARLTIIIINITFFNFVLFSFVDC